MARFYGVFGKKAKNMDKRAFFKTGIFSTSKF